MVWNQQQHTSEEHEFRLRDQLDCGARCLASFSAVAAPGEELTSSRHLSALIHPGTSRWSIRRADLTQLGCTRHKTVLSS